MSDVIEAQRGQAAEAVLSSAIYQESYAKVEEEITRKWRDSRDRDEREQLHQMLMMLGKVRSVLEGTMRSGKVAAAELERKQTIVERARKAIRG